MRVQSLGQKDPLEEGIATYSSILPGKLHGQRGNSHVPINNEMTTISILAASHRLPSSKIYISSRLLCPPLVHLPEGADKNPACRDAEGLSAQWA